MSDLFAEANAAAVDEDYERASILYDQSINQSTNPSMQMYVARATNYIKRKQYVDALKDCDKALSLASDPSINQSINQSTIAQAHYRRGQSLSLIDRFVDAKLAYQNALSLGHQQAELQIRKCDAEIKRLGLQIDQSNDQSTNQSTSQATSQSTSQPINQSINQAPLSSKVKDQWFQNESHVTITLFARDLAHSGITVKLEDDVILSARLQCKDGSVYEKTWRLFAPVSQDVKTDLTAYRLEIILEKKEPVDWLTLVEEEKIKKGELIARENVIRENITPHYPTSSKKKVEWSEVEQDVKKMEEEEKPTGDAALQKLFQTIYKDSDEDTRRAMIKSFQTSGGTVLSTNWKEVGKTDYTKDRKAPDGQEFVDPK